MSARKTCCGRWSACAICTTSRAGKRAWCGCSMSLSMGCVCKGAPAERRSRYRDATAARRDLSGKHPARAASSIGYLQDRARSPQISDVTPTGAATLVPQSSQRAALNRGAAVVRVEQTVYLCAAGFHQFGHSLLGDFLFLQRVDLVDPVRVALVHQ